MVHIIGIAGKSGSGKTTIARALQKRIGGIPYIRQDVFFKTRTPDRERPDALRNDLLIIALEQLKKGKSAYIPIKGGTERCELEIEPKKIIIVEGFLLFEDERIVKLCDTKIWIDISDEQILQRRVKRDGMFRLDYILHNVIPKAKEYEKKQKSFAEKIIDGQKETQEIVDEILASLDKKGQS